MLHRLTDLRAAQEALGPPQPLDFTFRNFIQRPGVLLFAGRVEQPAAILALRGADMMLHAQADEARPSVLDDLLHLRFAEPGLWPDAAARRDWARAGKPYVFVNSSPVQVWEDGIAADFEQSPERKPDPGAHIYWWQGEPRLARELRHSCRLGRGMELWDKLRQGVGYDPEGEYVRTILQEKPSFVCEVGGRPVCWSTIHLNGTMGMIFTPPEHRRHGYARSLASFQIDHQLRSFGFACCHVVADNVASYTLLLDLGATQEETRVVWRALNWPPALAPSANISP